MASLAIGAIGAIGGSGGGAERGATLAGGIDCEADAPTGGNGGGMLGDDTRGATGAVVVILFCWPCGTFGAIGALGAIGAFAACGRNRDGEERTTGSAASALPDGVFPDFCPASFAIRKF